MHENLCVKCSSDYFKDAYKMDNSTRNGLKWTSVQLSKFQCHYPLNQLSSFGFSGDVETFWQKKAANRVVIGRCWGFVIISIIVVQWVEENSSKIGYAFFIGHFKLASTCRSTRRPRGCCVDAKCYTPSIPFGCFGL